MDYDEAVTIARRIVADPELARDDDVYLYDVADVMAALLRQLDALDVDPAIRRGSQGLVRTAVYARELEDAGFVVHVDVNLRIEVAPRPPP